MSYQIDQSGKIEQTERHTIIALTNDTVISILLKRKEKRVLQRIFKIAGLQKSFPYIIFSILVALLFLKGSPKKKVTIDREYEGHEDFIEEQIILRIKQIGGKKINFAFGHVGKLSKAHQLAYLVGVEKKKPDIVVTAKEVMKILFTTKKSGSERLTQEWLPGDRRSARLKK